VPDSFGLSQAIAAMFGAGVVVVANTIKDKVARHRAEADEANRALLTLAQMYSYLHNFWNQVYREPVKEAAKAGQKLAPFQVQPLSSISGGGLSLNIGALSFLLRSHVPDIPNRLAIIEQSFSQHLLTEEVRAKLHLQMQLKFEAEKISEGPLTIARAREVCGDSLWAQLVALTDQQADTIPKTISRILTIQEQFLKVVNLQFPLRRFVRFQPQTSDAARAALESNELPEAARWRRQLRAAVTKFRNWRAKKKPPRSKVAK
jgi:hypothetical protein